MSQELVERIAELEQIVTNIIASALDQVSDLTMRAEAAESALSLAESRGRQIGREEAAKWHVEKASEAVTEAEFVSNVEVAFVLRNRAGFHNAAAAAIRNLPTNEAGE